MTSEELNELENLRIMVAELTTSVDVKDCPYRVFNGEGHGCRIHEDIDCNATDFINCLYRENARLKHKVQELENQFRQYRLSEMPLGKGE